MEKTMLLCAVLAMTAVMSVTADDDDAILSCCMPDKWEGTQVTTVLTTSFGSTYVTKGRSDVSYDAENEREVFIVKQTDSNGNFAHYKSLLFYRDRIGYNYDLIRGTCTTFNVPSFPKRCVPANSQVLDTDITLEADDNTLTASRVVYQTGTGSGAVYGIILLTEDCIPITETTMKSTSFFFNKVTNVFENIKEGLESEDIFDLPEACQSLTRSARSAEEAVETDFVSMTRLPHPVYNVRHGVRAIGGRGGGRYSFDWTDHKGDTSGAT